MRYSEIEDLLFCSNISNLLLDGVNYTCPFFALCDGIFGDAFWFYDCNGNNTIIYGGIVVDPIRKKELRIVKDVELLLPPFCEDNVYCSEYQTLYAEIHKFVFCDEITEKQASVVENFLLLLDRNEFFNIKRIYLELLPDFLQWALSARAKYRVAP